MFLTTKAQRHKNRNNNLCLSVFVVSPFLVFVSLAFAQEKWTRVEAEKILNHSAWGQTQTETDTSEMVYTPTTAGGSTTGSTRSENVRGLTDRQAVNNSR